MDTWPDNTNLTVVQGIVSALASKCGGHALTLTLAAGAVKRATKLRHLDTPGADQWESVMTNLTRRLRAQPPGRYSMPMLAYAVSVDQLDSETGKSILSTLCLFPAATRVPKEMVESVWHTQETQSHTNANLFEDGVKALVEANIVDVRLSSHGDTEGAIARCRADVQTCVAMLLELASCEPATCSRWKAGGHASCEVNVHSAYSLSADISFHLLLGNFLSSDPSPVKLHTLPGEGFTNSAAVVRAVVDLSSAGKREHAMDILKLHVLEPNAARTLIVVGEALWQLAQYNAALHHQQQALAICRETLGEPHPFLATSLTNMGSTLGKLGRHEEALQHKKQALAICRETLGDLHPDTATLLNNVGSTLYDLGRHKEALQHEQQALAIFTRTLGELHPTTATLLMNVGSTLFHLGRHEEALWHKQRALAIHHTTLGESHPITATSLDNVGATLLALGRHEEALSHMQQALAIRRESLGDLHPDTATSLNNLGSVLLDLGRHEDALWHMQQALTIRRETLGELHPDTAISLSNVGSVLLDLGRHEEALQHKQQALAVLTKMLGEAHPHTMLAQRMMDSLLQAGTRQHRRTTSKAQAVDQVRSCATG